MDTNAMLDACGQIADELAKIIAILKTEREVMAAEGKIEPERAK